MKNSKVFPSVLCSLYPLLPLTSAPPTYLLLRELPHRQPTAVYHHPRHSSMPPLAASSPSQPAPALSPPPSQAPRRQASMRKSHCRQARDASERANHRRICRIEEIPQSGGGGGAPPPPPTTMRALCARLPYKSGSSARAASTVATLGRSSLRRDSQRRAVEC